MVCRARFSLKRLICVEIEIASENSHLCFIFYFRIMAILADQSRANNLPTAYFCVASANAEFLLCEPVRHKELNSGTKTRLCV